MISNFHATIVTFLSFSNSDFLVSFGCFDLLRPMSFWCATVVYFPCAAYLVHQRPLLLIFNITGFFDLTLASLCGLCVYFPTFCFLNSNHTNLSGSSTYLMLYVQVERSLAITHRWQFSAHKTVFAEWEVQLRGSPGTRDLGPGAAAGRGCSCRILNF